MKRFIYSLLVLSIVSLPSYLFAQTTTPIVTNTTAAPTATQDTNTGFVPLTSLPGLASTSSAGATGSLPVFLSMLYKLCIGAAAVFAVIQIMRAGLRGITNNESVLAKSEARSMIQNAVIGLILVLSPYIIFSVIDSRILNLDFTSDFANLQSTPLTPQNTVDPNSFTSQLQALQCKDVTQRKFIASGDPGTCSTVAGKGFAAMDCCSNVPAGQMCCAYTATNDQNTPAPKADPNTTDNGTYSYDYYEIQSDYSGADNAKCYVHYPYTYDTQQKCTTAVNAATTAAKGTYAIQNNCNGTSGTPMPATSYSQIRILPKCD